MLFLQGRSASKVVSAEVGLSILEIAIKYDVDLGFSCTKGTCARCRCFVEQGKQYLSEPNKAEKARLEPEEIVQGYRLGCQAAIIADGEIKAINKPYF